MRILYISSVSYGWHKQRPQFVCEELSKHYDICYTSFTPIGKKKFKGSHKPERLKVKDLYVLPLSLKSGIIRFLNKILINLILNIKKYDKVIVTHPLFVSYLPENISVIYECMDNMTAFYEDKIKAFIGDCEKKLCLKSEKIIVSSGKLRINLIRDYNIDEEKITVVNNALDKNFTKSTAGTSLNTPNMVYVGTVDKWFDFETVEYFCNIHPEVSVYIVGKANCDINNAPSNMVFAGKVEHEKVFSYIKAADIVIMPFKVNELIECVDPVKMYEYQALNKTVISSYWEELDKFENVCFYNTKEEFVGLYETVKPNETKISQQFIDENCWGKRILKYKIILDREKNKKYMF